MNSLKQLDWTKVAVAGIVLVFIAGMVNNFRTMFPDAMKKASAMPESRDAGTAAFHLADIDNKTSEVAAYQSLLMKLIRQSGESELAVTDKAVAVWRASKGTPKPTVYATMQAMYEAPKTK